MVLWQIGSDRWRAAGGSEMGRRPHDGAARRRRRRSVETRAERGGLAAARPGGGSRRAAPESTGGSVTRPDLAAPMAQRPGAPRASFAAARSCTGQRRRRRRGPARGRAHGGSRRGRGDEGADEIASPREVGPSAVLDDDRHGGSEGSAGHPTRALPPAEIDLPGGGTVAAAAEA